MRVSRRFYCGRGSIPFLRFVELHNKGFLKGKEDMSELTVVGQAAINHSIEGVVGTQAKIWVVVEYGNIELSIGDMSELVLYRRAKALQEFWEERSNPTADADFRAQLEFHRLKMHEIPGATGFLIWVGVKGNVVRFCVGDAINETLNPTAWDECCEEMERRLQDGEALVHIIEDGVVAIGKVLVERVPDSPSTAQSNRVVVRNAE